MTDSPDHGEGRLVAELPFTKMLDMELRVWREKLVLAHHLLNLGKETLARQMYDEQLKQGWPGLAKEVDLICSTLGLERMSACRLDAKEFRKLVTMKLHAENEKRLKQAIIGSRKCERVKNEQYGDQKYFKTSTLKLLLSLQGLKCSFLIELKHHI